MIIHKDFAEHYARARDDQGDSLFDEITDIADEKPDGSMDVQAFNSRQRLRIDARKWAASKLKPKKYGDRIDLNHGGQSGNPVQVLTHAEAKRALENLLKLKDEVVS